MRTHHTAAATNLSTIGRDVDQALHRFLTSFNGIVAGAISVPAPRVNTHRKLVAEFEVHSLAGFHVHRKSLIPNGMQPYAFSDSGEY